MNGTQRSAVNCARVQLLFRSKPKRPSITALAAGDVLRLRDLKPRFPRPLCPIWAGPWDQIWDRLAPLNLWRFRLKRSTSRPHTQTTQDTTPIKLLINKRTS